jgi:hypothetical protein
MLLGCNRTPPAPQPPVAPTPPPVVNKEPEVAKDLTDIQLEELTVWFLIDGVRDNENELRSKVTALKDAEPKGFASFGGGQYGRADRWFRMSPIKDLEATAAKIDFGLVLAVDPVDRVILMDASAKPAPRPEKGWPGSKVIDEYIQRMVAKRFENYDEGLVKKLGRDKVVTVLMPGEVNISIVKKLQALAPVETDQYPGFYGPQKTSRANFPTHYFVLCVVAPIEKVSDVVKALDGAPNLVVAEEQRVVIVDFPALKPRWAAAKAEKPAPSK